MRTFTLNLTHETSVGRRDAGAIFVDDVDGSNVKVPKVNCSRIEFDRDQGTVTFDLHERTADDLGLVGEA